MKLWVTIEAQDNIIQPPHHGETIKEYLLPLAMSVNALAKQPGIGTARLNEIVRGERGITADTVLRLAAASTRQRNSGWACNSNTISA